MTRRSTSMYRCARPVIVLALLASSFALAACAVTRSPAEPGAPLRVVASANVWGSIAAEVGGERVRVSDLISNRNIDPHEYEPTVADARSISDASILIMNGVGYDTWVGQLAAASPDASRVVVNVGELAGVEEGSNPHLWYSPETVHAVSKHLAATYARLDPDGADYYAARLVDFRESGLARYDAVIAEVRSRYAGTPVGASESIFMPLAEALDLEVLTPEAFIDAVSEGADPTAASKMSADAQVRNGEIAVFVYNDQNATPDVVALVKACEERGIPVVRVSETLPPGATFAGWQTAQLEQLRGALGKATGR